MELAVNKTIYTSILLVLAEFVVFFVIFYLANRYGNQAIQLVAVIGVLAYILISRGKQFIKVQKKPS
jgi:hypothetical protein